MSIREEIKEQNQKAFQEMDAKAKWKHFWHYYKIHTFIALFVICFIIYMILHYTIWKPLPYGFAAYALDSNYYVSKDEDALNAFLDGFAQREGINTEDYQLFFDVSCSVDPQSTETLDMAIDMKLVTAGEHGDMDVLIGSPEQIDFYDINGFYQTPFETMLPEDLYKELDEQGLIYYYENEEQELRYPVGVYIKDAPRIKALNLYPEDAEPVLAIVSYSPRIETAVAFIEYIFETP